MPQAALWHKWSGDEVAGLSLFWSSAPSILFPQVWTFVTSFLILFVLLCEKTFRSRVLIRRMCLASLLTLIVRSSVFALVLSFEASLLSLGPACVGLLALQFCFGPPCSGLSTERVCT